MKVETFLGTVSTGSSYLAANAEVTQLVDTAWNFAYSCLWNMTTLSTKEVKAAKERIHEILTATKRPRRRFVAFCQRVLLARQRLTTATGLELPLPSLWLDKEDDDGFEMTRSWLQEINSVRESLPYYEYEIKVMAEAILQFSDTPSAQNYRYWSEYSLRDEIRNCSSCSR